MQQTVRNSKCNFYNTNSHRYILGIKETLVYCPFPYYVASSKRADRISTVLKGMGIDIPADSPRILSGLRPNQSQKKVEAL